MSISQEFAAVLADALSGRPYWLHLGSALRQKLQSARESPESGLISAFDYMLTSDQGSSRDRWGVFAPMAESSEGVYPAPVDKIDDTLLAGWAQLADQHEDPIVAARLNDLLWLRRWGPRPDLRARSALAAYRRLADERWSPLYRAHALLRAFEIAQELRDSAQQDVLSPVIVSHCRDALASEKEIPGVTMLLLKALVRAKRTAVLDDVEALLALAARSYPGRADVFEAVKDLECIWSKDDPARVEAARRAIVARWRKAAADTRGIAKQSHLQRALEHARLYGLSGEVEAILKEIQGVSVDDLDLKEFSAEGSIPREELDAVVEAIVGRPTWQECLLAFGGYGPPTGMPDANRETVRAQMRDFPLQFLITNTVVSKEGYPLHTATTDDEHFDLALAQHETLGVSIWAAYAPGVLSQIFSRHRRPARDALAQFFTTGIIRAQHAERLALAMELFLDGRFDEATHVAVPRLEAILRELCRQVGLVIIREPRNGKPGGVAGMGDLIAGLEGLLPEAWRRYLRNVLSDPIGTNLRNRLAHGLLDVATMGDAAVCLHIACYLRLLEVRPGTAQSR